MKTLRIFAFLCIISGLVSETGNCQPTRQEYSALMGIYVPCINELISGVVVWERTVWDNKIQIKVKDGILIGQRSGLEYSVTQIINHEMWYDQKAINKTFTRTLMIRLDCKLVARMPLLMHYTINANGEETVNFTNGEVDCK